MGFGSGVRGFGGVVAGLILHGFGREGVLGFRERDLRAQGRLDSLNVNLWLGPAQKALSTPRIFSIPEGFDFGFCWVAVNF